MVRGGKANDNHSCKIQMEKDIPRDTRVLRSSACVWKMVSREKTFKRLTPKRV